MERRWPKSVLNWVWSGQLAIDMIWRESCLRRWIEDNGTVFERPYEDGAPGAELGRLISFGVHRLRERFP